jgi:multicomponent Na+:H+ antiporter subunit F
MTLVDGLFALAFVLLVAIAASLWRIHAGPRLIDRMMGAQLIGTSGVAMVLLLAAATGDPTKLDVAIVLTLLAAFATVAFAKTASQNAAGDPENVRPEVENFAREEDRP